MPISRCQLRHAVCLLYVLKPTNSKLNLNVTNIYGNNGYVYIYFYLIYKHNNLELKKFCDFNFSYLLSYHLFEIFKVEIPVDFNKHNLIIDHNMTFYILFCKYVDTNQPQLFDLGKSKDIKKMY